jgi:hypothetical protein
MSLPSSLPARRIKPVPNASPAPGDAPDDGHDACWRRSAGNRVLLFDSRRFQLASPKALTPADRLELGLVNFRYWFGSANEFWRGAGYFAGRGLGPQAAFLLHQSVERYFAATTLVFTGYKPKSHNIARSMTAASAADLFASDSRAPERS